MIRKLYDVPKHSKIKVVEGNKVPPEAALKLMKVKN